MPTLRRPLVSSGALRAALWCAVLQLCIVFGVLLATACTRAQQEAARTVDAVLVDTCILVAVADADAIGEPIEHTADHVCKAEDFTRELRARIRELVREQSARLKALERATPDAGAP